MFLSREYGDKCSQFSVVTWGLAHYIMLLKSYDYSNEHRRPHNPVSMQNLDAHPAVIHALMGMPNLERP